MSYRWLDEWETFKRGFGDFSEVELSDRKTNIDITTDTRGMGVCVSDNVRVYVRVGVRSKVEWGVGDVAGGRHGGGRDRGGRGSRAVI